MIFGEAQDLPSQTAFSLHPKPHYDEAHSSEGDLECTV